MPELNDGWQTYHTYMDYFKSRQLIQPCWIMGYAHTTLYIELL